MKEFSAQQKEIIRAAIELIAESGIQSVTIKKLSQKIGIAESAIYRHFENKLEILLGILSQFRSSKMEALEYIQAADATEIEQLQMVFSERFKQFTRNPAITAVIFSEEIFQNDKRLADEVYAIMNSSLKMILSIIQRGQQNKSIRSDISADQLSLIIIGALRLLVVRWRLSSFSFDLTKEGEKLWLSIRQMIRA
ncbi:TetR/AcrR family transcriptional regulator [candidate division KSB1 bacterium]|nr:TetR/AcrR family transcriptional regulator [candidate division KSB1 bacterium]